jgi:ubiquinone/menaquinone biosynthesis C-methylase UbiE
MSQTNPLVQKQFGLHAQHYVTSTDHSKGESLDQMSALLPFEPHWRALDIATGGGHTALVVAPHVREVVASDITVPMLTAAEKFIRARGVTNVTFHQADACALPFAQAEFQLVTCRLAAHHFPDCVAFVRESARVLSAGGWFGLIDNVTPPEPAAARHINAFEKLRDPSHAWEYSAEDWRAFCQSAGLNVVRLDYYQKPLDFEPWCDRMSVPRVVRQQLRVLLWHAPGAARQSLNPRFTGHPQTGAASFELGEILLLARKS